VADIKPDVFRFLPTHRCTTEMEPRSLLVGLLLVLLVYILSTAAYRLFFSPISHFPGPRLAALTFWYEGYYDVVRDGRYTWKIKELHEKYGK
jgi:hypothetical protein